MLASVTTGCIAAPFGSAVVATASVFLPSQSEWRMHPVFSVPKALGMEDVASILYSESTRDGGCSQHFLFRGHSGW